MIRLFVTLAATAALLTCARAEPGYPNRPVRIIVAYGPGGVADVTTRIVAQKLTERLGQQFIVENRPGAGGIIAAKSGISAAADGYTLSLTGNGTAISNSLFKQIPYDAIKDFSHISTLAFFDILIVTKTGSHMKSIGDIIAEARANPGKLNFATVAPGSTQNLAAELFKITTGVKAAVVTYRTTPELLTGLIRGDVDVGFDFYAALQAAIADKQLNVVATAGPARVTYLSDVPTAKESGLSDYEVTSWNGISGPAGLPDDIVKLLSREINHAIMQPDVQAKVQLFGLEGRGTTPEEMTARMKSDIAKWAAVIQKAGVEKQ